MKPKTGDGDPAPCPNLENALQLLCGADLASKNPQTRPPPVPSSFGVPPGQPGRGQKPPASLQNPPEPLRSERHPPAHPINSSCPQGAVRTSIIIKRMMFISGHNVPLFLQQAEAEACGVAKVLLAPAMINAAAAHARRRGGTPEQPPRLPARWHRALSWPWGRKKKGVGAPVASVCLLLEASLGLQRVCFGFRVPRRERELGTPLPCEDFGSWSGVPPVGCHGTVPCAVGIVPKVLLLAPWDTRRCPAEGVRALVPNQMPEG